MGSGSPVRNERRGLVEWLTDAVRPTAAAQSRKLRNGGPKPLIDPAGRFVVYWSPKSACTTTLIWFLHVSGFAEEARRHSSWPHRYRLEVYNRSEAFHRALAAGFDDMRRIRVIRDPYDRAVSSFRHAVGTGYADEGLSAFLGRELAPKAKFSFREFLDYLESEDIATTNTHHRQQMQPIERRFPATDVINITGQDLFTELNRLEREMGLAPTDFSALDWLHRTEAPRKPMVAASNEPAYEQKMSAAAARGRAFWPSTETLLTEEARARLAKIYRADLEAYRDHI